MDIISSINFMEIFLSFIAGGICGSVFVLLKLPIPAPPVFSGVAGILGIYVGFNLLEYIYHLKLIL